MTVPIVHIKARSEIERRLKDNYTKSDIGVREVRLFLKAPDFVYLLHKIEEILKIKKYNRIS